MQQGVRFYDNRGRTTIELTTSLCRTLGAVDMITETGSVRCDCQRPWVCVYKNKTGGSYPVKIVIKDGEIVWQYLKDAIYGTGVGNYNFGMRLVYGSY
ncbi:hypothetical protein [Phascolarctobacterium succinatutens]|uniref:hypothetical protein n=1 Tax=Phascolarctobacterium succinatutens TaxID=626940 RepID=UPI0026F333A3|nr:hypothetical protein [Phascolarctobacterium succinatutens]